MLFTWDTQNLCIIFRQWRITGTLSLLLSLLAIVALTAAYEGVRDASRKYEQRSAAAFDAKGIPSMSDSFISSFDFFFVIYNFFFGNSLV